MWGVVCVHVFVKVGGVSVCVCEVSVMYVQVCGGCAFVGYV